MKDLQLLWQVRVPNHEGSAIAMAGKSSKPLVISNYNGNIRVPKH
jgi:hypothetical protein